MFWFAVSQILFGIISVILSKYTFVLKVVPKAMYHLIAESIAMNKQSVTRHDKQVFPDSEFIYNLMPDPDQVLDRYDIPNAVVC